MKLAQISNLPTSESTSDFPQYRGEVRNREGTSSSVVESPLMEVLKNQYWAVREMFKEKVLLITDLNEYMGGILDKLNSLSDGFPHTFEFRGT
jgi:hypothetical protein